MIWSWGHTMQYSALVKGLRLSPTSSLPFDFFLFTFGPWCSRYLKICPVSFASLFFHGGNELPVSPTSQPFHFFVRSIAFRSHRWTAGWLPGKLYGPWPCNSLRRELQFLRLEPWVIIRQGLFATKIENYAISESYEWKEQHQGFLGFVFTM